MIFSPKRAESSATPVSATTGFTLCSTLSRPPVTRELLHHSLIMQLRSTANARLRELDIELMRRLSPRVNVIPVVGKSDTLTPSELRAFKRRVRETSD
jgi:cell division control protein 11